jgi:hypothetical protein
MPVMWRHAVVVLEVASFYSFVLPETTHPTGLNPEHPGLNAPVASLIRTVLP